VSGDVVGKSEKEGETLPTERISAKQDGPGRGGTEPTGPNTDKSRKRQTVKEGVARVAMKAQFA